jgi:hypothetical protein
MAATRAKHLSYGIGGSKLEVPSKIRVSDGQKRYKRVHNATGNNENYIVEEIIQI